MSQTVLQVENLSKRYQLGATCDVHQTFREMIYRTVGRLRRKTRSGRPAEFWALRDICFSVDEGESVGIIGCNGTGKSTLLKILSSITDPTRGRAMVRGQVSSLLEVGTGFHPELTGRENIYLNGAILGMRRAEIRRKFDDIVSFAEVEKFIDTPVKRYSSGMYVRLAFAVAAHLEPQILIVDEVLAVGDASFQQRCLGKMKDVAEMGRTVLFVSHNLAAIKRLCQRALWLDRGHLEMDGTSSDVVSAYLARQTQANGECVWEQGLADDGVKEIKLLSVCVVNEQGRPTARIEGGRPFFIELRYRVQTPLPRVRVGYVLDTVDRELVFESCTNIGGPDDDRPAPIGEHLAVCRVPGGILAPRRYVLSVNAGIPRGRKLAHAENILAFDLGDHLAPALDRINNRAGVINPDLRWSQQRAA